MRVLAFSIKAAAAWKPAGAPDAPRSNWHENYAVGHTGEAEGCPRIPAVKLLFSWQCEWKGLSKLGKQGVWAEVIHFKTSKGVNAFEDQSGVIPEKRAHKGLTNLQN